MKRFLFIATLAALSLLVVSSCKKKPTPAGQKEVTIDSHKFMKEGGNWVYFSFEKGDVVPVSDPTKSKDWDLGFYRYNMVTNGPQDMSGQGAAYETDVTELSADIKIPPADQFKGNDWYIIAQESPMGLLGKKCTLEEFNEKNYPVRANVALTQPFYKINRAVNPPTAIPSTLGGCNAATEVGKDGRSFIYKTGGIYWISMPPPDVNVNPHVFIIRTANGKHAAVKFIDFQKDGKLGYSIFRYIYPLD